LKEVILCGHTGSNNHGCEAIIKGTAEILEKQEIKPVLATKAKEQDLLFGVEEFSDVISYKNIKRGTFEAFIGKVINRLSKLSLGTEFFHQRKVWKRLKKNIALNVGGDTYCYDIPRSSLSLNWFTSMKRIPNILWACSIEDTSITDLIKQDLKRYDLIMPRETLTYQNLIDSGIDESKLALMADPAFVLPSEETEIDEIFFKKGVVGINLSPLVIEECPNRDMVLKNYYEMINYILDNTKYNICFVPHVYSDERPQDLIPLKALQKKYKDTNRTMVIEDPLNCKELKYIISRCKLFVCARTHASIAAYSNNIPTLVVGYSVKSKGIAIDIFGNYEGYVIPTQSLSESGQLKEGFESLYCNRESIRKHLEKVMPAYKKKAYDAGRIIKELAKDKDMR